MAAIHQEFLNSEMFRKLKHRSWTMGQMVEHVENSWVMGQSNFIIETGTAWNPDDWQFHGQSTLVWDWVCQMIPEMSAVSIDIRKEASDHAREKTQRVSFVTGDSVKMLHEMAPGILVHTRLLYLDSFDWSPELNIESAFHHVCELAAVWPLLPSGCMVAVDDRHSADRGKHFLVQEFMKKLGIEPVFAEYQIAWVKP